jgi:hypothetical protein
MHTKDESSWEFAEFDLEDVPGFYSDLSKALCKFNKGKDLKAEGFLLSSATS